MWYLSCDYCLIRPYNLFGGCSLCERNDLRNAKHIEVYTKRERNSSRLSAYPSAPRWCAKSSDRSSVDTHLGQRLCWFHLNLLELFKLGLMTHGPMILWSQELTTVDPASCLVEQQETTYMCHVLQVSYSITQHSHGKSRRFSLGCECSYRDKVETT